MLLGRMGARRRVEFTGVEIAAPVEKAVAGLHTFGWSASYASVSSILDITMASLAGGARDVRGWTPLGLPLLELHAGELHPPCGELGHLRPSRDECGAAA
jgi:hypothetical protein